MKIIKGDLLNVDRPAIIVHQVNSMGVAGAGLALQIRRRWPDWFTSYQSYINDGALVLGTNHVWLTPGGHALYIVSMCAQDRLAKYFGDVVTDYGAFEKCLADLKDRIGVYGLNFPIYFPEKIGCGLAGGDWRRVRNMIRTVFPNAIIVSLEFEGYEDEYNERNNNPTAEGITKMIS